MENEIQSKPERLRSIDATRGYAMFWYIGGTAVFSGIGRILGHPRIIGIVDSQMAHAAWHGITFGDTMLPLFLFISGLTFSFSVSKRKRLGESDKELYLMILKRCLFMIMLGIIYNGLFSNFDFANIRYYSVLARLGISWALGGVIFLSCKKNWQRVAWCGGILIVYWLLLTFVSAPDFPEAGSLTMAGNIGGYIDRNLFPGHIYNDLYDPEGMLSNISAVSTVLMGMLTGCYISSERIEHTKMQRTVRMAAAAVALIVIGLLWSLILPINKRLWTSSFACLTGGIAILAFTIFYYLIDVRGKFRWWAELLTALGVNSIVAYFGYHLFGGFEYTSNMLFGGLASVLPDRFTPFIEAFGGTFICWAIMWFLYKKKIIIKL